MINRTPVQILDPNGSVVTPASEVKQDATNLKLETLSAELQQKTEPSDIQMSEMIPMLRAILTAIANPSYVDKSANQMRAQVTGTITTVTTTTTLTNVGSFHGDHLQRMNNMTAWSTNIRSLIT